MAIAFSGRFLDTETVSKKIAKLTINRRLYYVIHTLDANESFPGEPKKFTEKNKISMINKHKDVFRPFSGS